MSQNQKFSLLHWMIALTFGLVTTAATLGVLVMVLRMQADSSVFAHAERELFRLQMQLDADGVLLKEQKEIKASTSQSFLSAKSEPQERWLGYIRLIKGSFEFDFGPGICVLKEAGSTTRIEVFENHRSLKCMLQTGALVLHKKENVRFLLEDKNQKEFIRSLDVKETLKKNKLDLFFDGEKFVLLKDKNSTQSAFLAEIKGQWLEFSMQEHVEWQVATDLGVEQKELQNVGKSRALYRRVCRYFGCSSYQRILKNVTSIRQKKNILDEEHWHLERSLPVGRRFLNLESKVSLWRQP